MKENFKFKEWLNEAFLLLIKNALTVTAKQGMHSGHYFYINFNTDYKGIIIEDFLFRQYPNEITIVLQNQFTNLYVNKKGFGVSLVFDGKVSALYIPWGAVNSFYDPSTGLHLVVNTMSSFYTQHKTVDALNNVLLNEYLKDGGVNNKVDLLKYVKNLNNQQLHKSSLSETDNDNIIKFPKF